MSVPRRYRGSTIQTFISNGIVVQGALRALRDGRSVFLTGPIGSGKTHLGVGLLLEAARQAIASGQRTVPRFVSIADLWMDLKDAISSGISEREVLEEALNAKVVMLDDIGTEKAGEWARFVLYWIIDSRYRSMKQLIMTSNLSLEDLAQIDDRIPSRIVEMGVVCSLTGEDFRLKKAKERAHEV
jgi:DNA replication protein DnaC